MAMKPGLSTGTYVYLFHSLCHKPYLRLLKVAGNHGRAVGVTISGKPQPFAKTPVFWSARTLFRVLCRVSQANLIFTSVLQRVSSCDIVELAPSMRK